MIKVRVNFCSMAVKYLGNLEDIEKVDLYFEAREHAETACIDYYEMMTPDEAEQIDGVFDVVSSDPARHLCMVYWSEIDEDYDGRTDEDRDYDAECEWANKYIDDSESGLF